MSGRIAVSVRGRAAWDNPQKNAALRKAAFSGRAIVSIVSILFDLRFTEDDVLACDGIVLLEFHLARVCTCVLLGDVEISGVRGGDEPDLDDVGLCHEILGIVPDRRSGFAPLIAAVVQVRRKLRIWGRLVKLSLAGKGDRP